MDSVRVGVIGARADRGWAGVAHIPAIKSVPALSLHGVSTSNPASAETVRASFGAALAFGDPYALIAHPEIDLVTVCVKAVSHRELVLAAAEAGKHILCEWPLGASLAQTLELRDAAAERPGHTAIMLQGRFSPWINHLRRLIAEGFVGRILSSSMIVDDELSTGTIAAANAHMLDPANGSNPLTIHAGHFLDYFCHVLGEFASVSARLATSRRQVRIRETGEPAIARVPDQIMLAATLCSGAVASVHIRAGTSPGPNLLWDIQGEDGFLRVTCQGYLHWRPLQISGARGSGPLQPIEVPFDLFDSTVSPGEGPHQNVAYAYAALARALRAGTPASPDFAAAATRHRLVETIALAAKTGREQVLAQT